MEVSSYLCGYCFDGVFVASAQVGVANVAYIHVC